MGCAPTNRKRTIVPAGQGKFKDEVKETQINQISDHQIIQKLEKVAGKDVVSYEFKQNHQVNKENGRIATSTRLIAKNQKGQQRLPFPDIIIREERRQFQVEKMDFGNRQHLTPL